MENATAKVSCFARAYHYRHNSVHVFADAAAEKLLGADYDQIAQSMAQGIGFFMPDFHGDAAEGLRLIVDRQLSPSVLCRSAYCERMLANKARLDCKQYLLLAAGYDTFAIRHRDTPLAVFELDLPEMLADKRARMARAGLESSVVDVPCDLSQASWRDSLLARGFRPEVKSFASLLGISYYLDRDEFKSLLLTLAEIMPEGAAICFDYPAVDDGQEARTNRALAQGAGERMKAQYACAELEALLAECGFPVYEHLGPDGMTGQYFADYNRANPARRMEAPKGVGYVLAVRKP